MFVGEKNVGRFDIAMNQPFCLRGAQPLCHLNASFDYLFLRQALSLLDKIVETSVIDQFHHQIKLIVIDSRGENLDHIGMIDRRGHTRFLSKLRGLIDSAAAEILAQQLQRNETIKQRVARFVNGAHAADPERFEQNEIVERTLDAHFFTTLRASNAGERLGVGRVDGSAARWAALQNRVLNSHSMRL